jgi:hypothetical protein
MPNGVHPSRTAVHLRNRTVPMYEIGPTVGEEAMLEIRTYGPRPLQIGTEQPFATSAPPFYRSPVTALHEAPGVRITNPAASGIVGDPYRFTTMRLGRRRR